MKRKLIILCAVCFLLSGCSAKEAMHMVIYDRIDNTNGSFEYR